MESILFRLQDPRVALFTVICLSLLIPCLYSVVKYCRLPPLPPGPKGRYPFLGMTFDMPKKRPWIQIAHWAEEYGPLMHLRIGFQDFIFISDGQVARDLLDKRGNVYSSRPPSVVGDIISGGMRSVLMPYGHRWRRVRKIFASILTSAKCDGYNDIQGGEAIATLHDIERAPEHFEEHIHRYSLSVARSVAYGQRVSRYNDPFAVKIKQLMLNFAAAMTPGKYLVESIPAMKYLPRPLKPWLKVLEDFRDYEHAFSLENYRTALAAAEKHPDRPSLVLDLKREAKASDEEVSELQAATTCAEILGAGSDTTATSILALIQACVAFPEVVKKAHEELDRVVGRGRFPTWKDEPSLPYIRAMIKEQHRWRTIAPMSFSHYSTAEDVYNGYRIPKGSVVRVNTWAIHMDPKRYPNPTSFEPSRFLAHSLSASAYANSPNVSARDHWSYGSSKRICVGMHLAERSLFNMVSRLLQAFDIKHAVDENGKEIPVDVNAYKTSLIAGPEPFKARFVVRAEEIGALLDSEWQKLFGEGEKETWSQ